jgi:hypothetical protein
MPHIPGNLDTPPKSSLVTRRDFAEKSLQSLLAVSLLDHLCSADLLAEKVKPTAIKWLNEVNQVGLDLKNQKMQAVEWQQQIENLLSTQIDLKELTDFIDFDKILKHPNFVDNGARSHRPRFPRMDGIPERLVFGQQIFALRKGRSVVPHGHDNMATAFLILKGNFHGRHYDRVEDEQDHMIIRPTIDGRFGPGQTSSVSDDKDNVHWFKAEDEPAFIFNLHVLGVNPKSRKRTSRLYVDPFGEKLNDGLVRARLIDYKESHTKFG